MANDRTTKAPDPDATAPGGGRQSVGMQRAAEHRPIRGGGLTDILAASGGLDLPGTSGAGRDAVNRVGGLAGSVEPDLDTPAQSIFPGERDASTQMAGSLKGIED